MGRQPQGALWRTAAAVASVDPRTFRAEDRPFSGLKNSRAPSLPHLQLLVNTQDYTPDSQTQESQDCYENHKEISLSSRSVIPTSQFFLSRDVSLPF